MFCFCGGVAEKSHCLNKIENKRKVGCHLKMLLDLANDQMTLNSSSFVDGSRRHFTEVKGVCVGVGVGVDV